MCVAALCCAVTGDAGRSADTGAGAVVGRETAGCSTGATFCTASCAGVGFAVSPYASADAPATPAAPSPARAHEATAARRNPERGEFMETRVSGVSLWALRSAARWTVIAVQ